MINLDFLQFDQMNLFFAIASVLCLIRTRGILPIVIVIFANLIHGSLVACFLAAMIFWFRTEQRVLRTVQLKDVLGFFFLLIAAVTTGPLQAYSALIGIVVMSICFGLGALGIIPALVLLRQYAPHPPLFEIVFGSALFYILGIEILKLTKSPHEKVIQVVIETLAIIGILTGLKDLFFTLLDDNALFFTASGTLAIVILFSAVVFLKRDWSGHFYQNIRDDMRRLLSIGNNLLSRRRVLPEDEVIENDLQQAISLDPFFVSIFVIFVFWGLAFLIALEATS